MQTELSHIQGYWKCLHPFFWSWLSSAYRGPIPCIWLHT